MSARAVALGALVGIFLAGAPSSAAAQSLEDYRPLAEATFPGALGNCPGGVDMHTEPLSPGLAGAASVGRGAYFRREVHRLASKHRRLRGREKPQKRRRVQRKLRRARRGLEHSECEVVIRDDWLAYLGAANTCAVVVHEYGHLAGYQHVDDPTSIMYTYPTVQSVPACA